MRTNVLVAAAILVVSLAVPTAAVATGGEDEVAEAVTLSPSDGPNGEYATVEDGELRVDFDGLLSNARHTAHDVFTITVTNDEPVRVWVETDLGDGVTAYQGANTDATLDSRQDATELQPGETIDVGFAIDTTAEVPESGTLTVGVLLPEDEPPGTTPGSGTPTGTDAPTDTDTTTEPATTTTDATPDPTTPGPTTTEPPTTEPTTTEPPTTEPPTPIEPDGANVSVTGATVTDSTVETGEPATITATVANSGDETGTATIELTVDGEVVATRTVEVAAGTTETVEFEHVFEAAGAYEVAVGGVDAGTVTVTASDRSGTVANVTASADVIAPGDEAAVFAEIDNVGAATDTFDVTVTGGSETFDLGSVTLDPGESTGLTRDLDLTEPGEYEITVRAVDSAGQSDQATARIVVNDQPSVTIEGAGNASDGESTLRANVTNVVGSATVTWTLPDGSTTTGREVIGRFVAGETVRTTVEDEHGASDTATATIGGSAPGGTGSLPSLVGVPLGVPLWLQLGLTTLSVFAAAASVRSSTARRIGGGVARAIDAVTVDGPRIEAVENPWWNPERGAIEIDELRVESPGGLLDSVEITITDEGSGTVVEKTIDAGARSSYAAEPERIPVYGDIDLSETGTYTIRIRAVDERERISVREQSQEGLFALGG